MSKQTQNGPIRWRGDPTVDADVEAPTAPHAKPRPADAGRPKKPNGPARFWSPRGVRIALAIAALVSVVFHAWVSPWNFLPNTSGVAFDEPDGDLAIPVDLLGEEPPPAPPETPPAPTTTEPPPTDDPNGPGKRDAGPPKMKDAGVPLATLDAGIADAGEDADVSDASITDASDDSGLYADNDDGGAPGSNGPRDPEAMFGLSKTVNAGPQNIVLGINVALIRKHPVGSRLGPVLKVIHQWRDFLKDSPIDPIFDTDWILIYGPSLRNTDKDAVLVHYNTTDKIVDSTIANIAKASVNGGGFDAGVKGVPGTIGRADNGDRVFIRPQSKLLVIVPPSHAHEAALTFKKQTPRGPPPKEALRLVMKNPSNEIKIPKLKFQQGVTEIRLWIIPKDDGNADLYFEGDCIDEATAQDSADKLTELVRDLNGIGVRIATHGLLNGLKVTAEGKKIAMHQVITQDQLEALLQIAAAQFGVQVPPPPGAPGPPATGSEKPTIPPPNE